MKEAELLCERIAFLKKGELIANATPVELKRQMKLGEKIIIEFEGRFEISSLKDIPEILDMRSENGKLIMVAENVEFILNDVLKKFRDVHIRNIEISQPDLEDVFLKLAH